MISGDDKGHIEEFYAGEKGNVIESLRRFFFFPHLCRKCTVGGKG